MRSFHSLKELEGVNLDSTKDERIQREDAWVRGINKGSGKSFEAMYKYYYPRLGQFLLRFVHSQKTAEDLIHDLFYNIWQNRTKLEPRGTLRAYLYTAARNQALKYINRNKEKDHSALADYPHLQGAQTYPKERIEYKEFEKAFWDAVKKLPDKRRQIFLLHREDKLTYREIAEVLDISIKTVETQMSRSIKFLSNTLKHFRD